MLNAVEIILNDFTHMNSHDFLFQPLTKQDISYTIALRDAITELGYLLTHSLTHLLTYSLTHSLTHSLTYSLTHSLTHSLRL
jgi:hypothetical protein